MTVGYLGHIIVSVVLVVVVVFGRIRRISEYDFCVELSFDFHLNVRHTYTLALYSANRGTSANVY